MGDTKSTPTHFALLIGVNSDSQRPLKGCVRDVREITKYLNKSLTRLHTHLLTAEDDSPASVSERTAIPELLATYSNVKSALAEILSSTRPGTYVYIHYSGHGVRMEASSRYSSRSTGDLALNVLEHAGDNLTQPLPGMELAQVLKEMVSRGAIVTLVLDCCFSGSVLRDKSAVLRCCEYDPEIDKAHVEGDDDDGGDRNAYMFPNWLVSPEGYTVITACGPHEVAMELKFPGRTYRHGALSYFILQTIEKLGGLGGKHAHIYPYLCSLFRQYRPTQNPMWYGNPELYFFGEQTLSPGLTGGAPFAVVWSGSCLQLQGGEAHGICEGDQFAVYTGPASDLVVSDPETILGKKGRIARALTHHALRRYPIKLDLGPLLSKDWHIALANRDNLVFEETTDLFAFCVAMDGGEYLIRDNRGCPGQVLDVAERLAKFELIRDIKNKSGTPLESQCSIQLMNSAGEAFQSGSIINTRERDRLKLIVKNRGQTTLYVHVYNLAPLNQISNILAASYIAIPPRDIDNGFTGEWTHVVGTMIPRDLSRKGISSCEDVIKLLITSQPTSFASFEMQKLNDSHDRVETDLAGKEQVSLGSIWTEDWVAVSFRIRTEKNG
ncbi:hypothetical protein NPX13_g6423 [Xylaria arbuscula]|uniref:Peptidase C14 caspase domain-containing protein n=1 Tax=Xylaria arbuscula TaxID=114810 RepID=A0A9W8TLF7_9PEZI|nr:hypothetical protein NPX13_g6423 [Xylaria arbuscula]